MSIESTKKSRRPKAGKAHRAEHLYVAIVGEPATHPQIKVGRSGDVQQRMRQLRQDTGLAHTAITVFEGRGSWEPILLSTLNESEFAELVPNAGRERFDVCAQLLECLTGASSPMAAIKAILRLQEAA